MMGKLLLALQFLTIVPIRDTGRLREEEVGKIASCFPVIGLVEGLFFVGVALLLLGFLPGDVVTGVLVLLMVVMNGALHLDGLADTVDAVASRAGQREKLAIMKESSTGAAGVAAVVLALLLKYIMLNSLLQHAERATFHALLLLMPVMARWAMVPALFYGKPARQDGLGRIFLERTGSREMFAATALMFVIILMVTGITAHVPIFLIQSAVVFPVLYGFSIAAVRFFHRQFSGLTGDSFGAVHEIAALLFLLVNLFFKGVQG